MWDRCDAWERWPGLQLPDEWELCDECDRCELWDRCPSWFTPEPSDGLSTSGGGVRASVYHYNTATEVDRLLEAVSERTQG